MVEQQKDPADTGKYRYYAPFLLFLLNLTVAPASKHEAHDL